MWDVKRLKKKKNYFFGRFIGAGEGIRTLDFNLGKVARYHEEAPFLNETLSFFALKINTN